MFEDIAEAVETSAEEGKGKTRRTSMSLRRNYAFYLIGLDAVIFLLTRLPNLNGIPIHIDECLFIAWAQGALRGAKWWSLVDGKPPLHPCEGMLARSKVHVMIFVTDIFVKFRQCVSPAG